MKIRFDVISLFLALLLFAGAPVAADEAAPQPEVAPAAQSADAQATDAEPMGCAAGKKCCGSAACAAAKQKSMEGKAAIADCPCKRNRAKPKHGG